MCVCEFRLEKCGALLCVCVEVSLGIGLVQFGLNWVGFGCIGLDWNGWDCSFQLQRLGAEIEPKGATIS